ncbi:MAG: Stp1/IreP family PP2C-type Ser/Thr phosphatase [Flavisolibacter sp.]
MAWFNLFKSKKKVEEKISEEIFSGPIKAVIVSDLGNIRTNNEDVGLFFRIADEEISQEKGSILLVADGMGGHQAGEVASQMAAQIISHEYYKQNGSIEKSLEKAFETANREIFELASKSKAHKGMGTTCTALVIFEKAIYYAHAGDSRAYILKQDGISQITQDHTYVNELVNRGEITAEAAATHPERNILTNAMGTKPTIRVDTGRYEKNFEETDRLLLCSDGLYDYIKDSEMGELLSGGALPDIANNMVALAKKRGGHDNITVVLAERILAAKEAVTKETRDFDIPATKEYDLS